MLKLALPCLLIKLKTTTNTTNLCMNISSQNEKYIEVQETQGIKFVNTFEELNLSEDLLRGIYGYGFEKPSVIQQKGILPLLKKTDTIIQAQSGTGKTATFSIGILQLIDTKSPNCQALILVPTRELAQQIQRVIQCLGQYLNVSSYLLIGGTKVADDIKHLKQNTIQIVVGTPGRVADMMRKKFLNSDHLKVVVFDEADEILGNGFIDQIRQILEMVPSDVQLGLFSATMQPEILELTDKFMRNPVKVLVKKQELTLDGIKQFYITVDKEEWKFDTLVELYKNIQIGQCMIFANKKQTVITLASKLKALNFIVSEMHGDMDMIDREIIMKQFRTGSSRVLITSDLLSRGIDIQQVNLIINYDLPTRKQKYIHRIGRSGRFGRRGVAINFVTPSDAKYLVQLRQYYNTQIAELPLDLQHIYEI